MKNLSDLLKNKKQIWFFIDDDKNLKKAFLMWAKQNGCAWNNAPIFPQTDHCSVFMGIDSSLTLGYVGAHCWFLAKNASKKINFKDLLGGQIWKIS